MALTPAHPQPPSSFLSRRIFLAATVSAACCELAWAAAEPWPEGAYVYFADQKSLGNVLREFCSAFGLQLRLTSGANSASDEVLNGRFSATSPGAFLDQI